MKVKTFIKKLQKLDQNAEVVHYEPEAGFYAAASVYKDKNFTCYDEWISIENKPAPKRIVQVG
jgi:hypothetical protein